MSNWSWAVFTHGGKLPLFCVHANDWPGALAAVSDELERRNAASVKRDGKMEVGHGGGSAGHSDLSQLMLVRMRSS